MKSLERKAQKVRKGHYVATHNSNSPSPQYGGSTNRAYFSDGEDSRPPSERTLSEFTIHNERSTPPQAPARKHRDRSHNRGSDLDGYFSDGPRPLSSPPKRPAPRAPLSNSYDNHGADNGDIYISSAAYKAPSELSRYSGPPHRTYQSKPRSIYSVASSRKTGRSAHSQRRMGARVEAMTAPNPFCPNIRGVCCLMLLINLGLILVTLGFVLVIQFVEPLFVW